MSNQTDETTYLHRFAFRTHDSYDQAAAMRFALEHQNPLVVGPVVGGSGYPEASYSLLAISDPNVLLWALKPAEEGIDHGVILRMWNLAPTSKSVRVSSSRTIVSAKKTTHIETDIGTTDVTDGTLAVSFMPQQMLTHRVFLGSPNSR